MANLHSLRNHSNLISHSSLLSNLRNNQTLTHSNPSTHHPHRHTGNRRLDRIYQGKKTTPKTNRRNPTPTIKINKRTPNSVSTGYSAGTPKSSNRRYLLFKLPETQFMFIRAYTESRNLQLPFSFSLINSVRTQLRRCSRTRQCQCAI